VYFLDVSEHLFVRRCGGQRWRWSEELLQHISCRSEGKKKKKNEEEEEEEDSEGSDGGREAQARTFRSQEFAFLPYLCRR